MTRYQKIIGALVVLTVVGAISILATRQPVQVPEAPMVTQNPIDEAASVEDYVRSNIAKLSPEPAVLGGTWYVVDLSINTKDRAGVVTYEDGHIQGTADFTYQVDANGTISSVTLVNK